MKRRNMPVLLVHAGLFFILAGGIITGILGTEGFIEIKEGQNADKFFIEDNISCPLGFTLYLDKMSARYYPGGRVPKSYKAEVSLIRSNRLEEKAVIEPNHPLGFGGYRIYQYGYDRKKPHSTLFQVVKDPGMSFAYAGFLILFFGMFFSFRRVFSAFAVPSGNRAVNISIAAVAVILVIFIVLFFRRVAFPLVPALQSVWLLPHVGSCFAAYSNFAFAFIAGIILLLRKKGRDVLVSITHRCICLGFILLTAGIMLGAVWGKQAWGHWWNWDPKETWALITWIIYAVYFHAGLINKKWRKTSVPWFAIMGFLLVLFNYLGVTYLMKGLHSYGA